MLELTQRRQNVISGAIALLLLVSATTVGVKSAFGAFDGGFIVTGSFEAAGQGMLPGSDVKVRGVNVGKVRSIRLEDGRAEIRMQMYDGEDIPADAVARIRAKTLFGEKFVDLDLEGTDEREGPFLGDGDRIAQTDRAYELEEVLSGAFPVLEAIDPDELAIVISQLAEGGRGLGENINRTFVNGAAVSDVFAEHVDDTSEFLRDFASLSDQLADSAEDLVGIAVDGNVALPVLNDHEAELIEILQQTGRLSNDVADLLLGNQDFVDAALGDGSRALQVLYDRRTQVVPLVVGLRQYLQTLTEVIRIPVGDGTLMAGVKAILGNQICLLVPCGGAGNDAPPDASPADLGQGVAAPASGPPTTVAPPADGSNDILDLLSRVLGA